MRLFMLLLAHCAAVMAQQAALQGIVTDASGAAIARASIAVTQPATGVVHNTETNETGFYSLPFLVPGSYSVKASSPGFATKNLTGLTLEIGGTVRADFSLHPAGVDTVVDVSASTGLLDTETSTVGQMIANDQVVELPLNDRNYLELAMLTPGATPADGARNSEAGGFSAGGSRANQMNVTLDGIDNASRLSGGQLGFEAQAVTPSVDAVQEFRVVTNNNSAEFGFRMGGAVMVQTKSGTNSFRGSLYEFSRNDKLAANNFFVNRAGAEKPSYKRNQFGGTLGGRIVRDKTFFFLSYEARRIHVGEENTPTLPPAAFKRGDFSEALPLFDPATTRSVNGQQRRDPFPGNQIPVSRFDTVGAKVGAWYPDPTLPGKTRNFFFSPVNTQDTGQFDARFDHNFSGAQRVFFRYSRRDLDSLNPGPLPLPADGGLWSLVTVLATSYVANWNATLTPSTNNELRFGFTRSDSNNDVPRGGPTSSEIGVKGLPDLGGLNNYGTTRFVVTNYADLGSRSFWPNPNVQNVVHISDQLTRVLGRHLMKAGVDFRYETLGRAASRYARGVMNFNGSYTQDPANRGRTGESFADLLLGQANGGTLSNVNGEEIRVRNFAGFFQDDFKLSSRLTLNLGVRWDRFGVPSFTARDRLPVGRFQLGPPGTSEFTILRPKDDHDCGCRHDNNNFAPRMGLAFRALRSTVVRTGFGYYYGTADSYMESAIWRNGPPDYKEIAFPGDRLSRPGLIASQGFPAGILTSTEFPANLNVATADPFRPSQYAMHWFFDLQQQMPLQSVLTVSYLANATRQMVWQRDINRAPGAGPGSIESRQPWPFFDEVTFRQAGGNSSFQALAAKYEKRFTRGMMYLFNYTWAHTIDDGAGSLGDGVGNWRDPYRISLDRGNSNYDRRHAFVGTFIYDLPFGRRGRWGRQWNKTIDGALGGWQLAGIGTLRSGRKFSPTVTGNPANSDGTNYANRLGDGGLPASQRSVDRWFDLAAFAMPAQYEIGNAGRNILTGPATRNGDLKIAKNFHPRERIRIEVRGEMFNFTNTANFGVPNAVLNNVNYGTIASAAAPRIVQFGLKLMY